MRAFADNSVATFEFLLAHGVKVIERGPDRQGGHEVGLSVLAHAALCDHGLAAHPDRQA